MSGDRVCCDVVTGVSQRLQITKGELSEGSETLRLHLLQRQSSGREGGTDGWPERTAGRTHGDPGKDHGGEIHTDGQKGGV